ncbi:hypothetical protein PIROE2DRAFT_11088, partial [Piromyces sp. E2]
ESKPVKLRAVALSYDKDNLYYNIISEEFNKYAIDNDLNVELDINIYNFSNSTNLITDYRSSLEYLLNKGSLKYDIYFFDNGYTKKYMKHLMKLNDYFSEEYFSLYSKNNITLETCIYNEKLISLPVHLNYRILYVNKDLLKKHDRNIPKTWDELLNTGKYIIAKEKELGNNNIIGYNGFVPDSEESILSVEEFIYSYRNSKDSKFPNYESDEAINALKKLKEIKDEMSSDEIYKSNEGEIIKRLLQGKDLFLKFWIIPNVHSSYQRILLLGGKEGVSGSAIGGFNVAINHYISDSRKILSIKALKFMTSMEIQKKLLIETNTLSAIDSLYEDREVCSAVNCSLVKNIQSFYHNYDEYYDNKFKKYIQEFIYGNKTANETLEQIRNINKIYYISISPNISMLGFVVFMTIVVLSLLMLFSLSFLFIEKFKLYFEFLKKCFGILLIELLLFMEWNIKKTMNDVKSINSAVTVDIIFVVLLIIISSLDIKNVDAEFILNSILSISVSLTNFIFIYASKILWINNELSEKQKFFNKAMKEMQSSNSFEDGCNGKRRPSTASSNRRASVFSNRRESIISKIITCHYYPDSEFDIDKEVNRSGGSFITT